MNLLKRNLPAIMLLTALASPAAVMAETVPVASPAASVASNVPTQAERMELMQTMRSRMHEMMQTEDPIKRRELIDAQSRDMEAMMKMGPPGPGMGMMMGPGGMGAGPGMMMGQPGNPNCKLGQGSGMGMMMDHVDKCDRHDNTTDLRLDALEKRMDMMQMMMRMMMRH